MDHTSAGGLRRPQYWLLVALAGLLLPAPAAAQEFPPLEVGVAAPDFALTGATSSGILDEPVRLSEFRGKTVVLAFFFQARTRG